MKKLLLTFVALLCMNQFISAQDSTMTTSEAKPRKNELKLNIAYMIAGVPELTYERIIGQESAIGISTSYTFENLGIFNFYTIPYFRVFFGGNKAGTGFFVEANASYIVTEEEFYSSWPQYGIETRNYHNFGIGSAIGFKFMNNSNWVMELLAGAGRNLTHPEKNFFRAYPRLGVQVGKRF